jgi:hypothetical protein
MTEDKTGLIRLRKRKSSNCIKIFKRYSRYDNEDKIRVRTKLKRIQDIDYSNHDITQMVTVEDVTGDHYKLRLNISELGKLFTKEQFKNIFFPNTVLSPQFRIHVDLPTDRWVNGIGWRFASKFYQLFHPDIKQYKKSACIWKDNKWMNLD